MVAVEIGEHTIPAHSHAPGWSGNLIEPRFVMALLPGLKPPIVRRCPAVPPLVLELAWGGNGGGDSSLGSYKSLTSVTSASGGSRC